MAAITSGLPAKEKLPADATSYSREAMEKESRGPAEPLRLTAGVLDDTLDYVRRRES